MPAAGNLSATYRLAKRAFDLLGAAALLVLLGPLMLAVLAVLSVTTAASRCIVSVAWATAAASS